MRDHLIKSNLFTKLDFENSHLVPEFRCYYDRANDDYILSKSALFHLLQKPSTEISKQIVLQENKASSFQEIFSSWPWPAQSLIKKEKAKLFHLLQIYNSSETSRQIAIQSHHESYQSADLSMMVSLKEVGQSAQISPTQLDKIKEDIYILDSNSWFQVHQNGEIFLTNQMLLEALQQISKSRDDKFFSEHFICIAKDFDPSQPSQYSAQSLKDYMDWLAGLNQDKILQSNIDQLKNKCENGQAGEMVNLQDFLDKSNFESNLLRDINNYFKDSLFMTKNSSDPKSNGTLKKIGISEIIEKLQTLNSLSSDSKKLETYQVSCDHKFGDFPMNTIIQVVKSNDREYSLFNNRVYESRTKDLSNSQYLSTYEEFLKKIDEDIELAKEKIYENELKTEKIIDLLGQLNDLSNTSQNLEVTRNSNNTVEVKTKNSYFSLDKSTQKVLYYSETRKESSNYSFDDFINELNKSIKKEDKNISSQIYQAPTSHPALLKFDAGSVTLPASGQENDNSTSQKYMSYVGQTLQPTLQQPAMSYVGQPLQPTLQQPAMSYVGQPVQPWQLTSQPRSCLPNATPLTFPTIHGSLITYPSNFLHTLPGSSLNPYGQVYSSPVLNTTFTALSCGVGGGAMGTGYWSRQVYGGQLTTIQSQPMSYMSSIIPGTAVYGARNMGGVAIYVGPPR